MLWQLNSIRDVPLFSLSLATSELSWWLSSKESACQCRRHRFSPWVGKIPWSRKWQPTPILLPRKLHGQRSLAATVHWVSKCRTRLSIHTDTHTHTRTLSSHLGSSPHPHSMNLILTTILPSEDRKGEKGGYLPFLLRAPHRTRKFIFCSCLVDQNPVT